MTFVTWAALGIAALVAIPLFAHLRRRRPPDEQPFAATRFVREAPAIASRRNALEERALFALRALAVLALAVLGASPFVRCQRLSLARPSGASVALAIVIDDSLSMRARVPGAEATRLDRALEAANELVGSLQQGDAVALVLAGRPVRVALAATTNLDAARAAVDSVKPSDRSTDLDGAVRIAGELVAGLEPVDRRVVVLGDRLGDPGVTASVPEGVRVWSPLDAIAAPFEDCATVRADRSGARVEVHVACTAGAMAGRRRLAIVAGSETLIETPLVLDGPSAHAVLTIPDAQLERHGASALQAIVLGGDAIPEDDAAPVVAQGGGLRALVVSDPVNDRLPTGGAPLVEQAFRAVDPEVQLTPLAGVPEQAAEFDPYALAIVDDAPGLTPEQRRDLAAWVERGGVALFALGPRAGAAPLGSGFSPLVPAIVRWRRASSKGVAAGDDRLFADASEGLDDLAPEGRALLEFDTDGADVATLARWDDGAPFAIERTIGRGKVLALTLPLASQLSDFALRPGFFALLDRVLSEARARHGTGRTVVGTAWSLAEGGDVAPSVAGLHETGEGEARRTRVATLDEREFRTVPMDLPRTTSDDALGASTANVDASPTVALVLLGLFVVELAVRAWRRVASRRAIASS